MKRIITIILLLATTQLIVDAQTPTWQWAKSSPTYGNMTSGVYSLGTDNIGSVYLSGSFSDSITFGNFTLHSSSGSAFIVKMDSGGNTLWARNISGNGNVIIPSNINGDVFISGWFYDSLSLPGQTIYSSVPGETWGNIFAAKLDSGGNVVWAKSTYGGFTSAIKTDSEGNIYVTGQFRDSMMVWGNDTARFRISDCCNYLSMFLVKLNSVGDVQWIRNAKSGTSQGMRLASDIVGNIYLAGEFGPLSGGNSDTVVMGSDTVICSNLNVSSSVPFIAKYDSSGNFLWDKTPVNNHTGVSAGIACDDNGNVFVLDGNQGNVGDSISFGSFTVQGGFCIVKYDSNGNAIALTGAGIYASANNISVDASGSVYVSGEFNSLGLNYGSQTLYPSASSGSLFVMKCDNSGNILWAITPNGAGSASSMAAYGNGQVYLGGSFSADTIIFGSSVLAEGPYEYTHGTTYFLAKLGAENTSGIFTPGKVQSANLYPNPANDVVIIKSEQFTHSNIIPAIYDMTGRKINLPYTQDSDRIIIDTKSIISGLYYFTAVIDGVTVSGKFIKM